MRISDWSSDVCSSDLADGGRHGVVDGADAGGDPGTVLVDQAAAAGQEAANGCCAAGGRVVMWPTFNAPGQRRSACSLTQDYRCGSTRCLGVDGGVSAELDLCAGHRSSVITIFPGARQCWAKTKQRRR